MIDDQPRSSGCVGFIILILAMFALGIWLWSR